MATTSTRGVYHTLHLDETLRKGVYESPVPNYNFLYETSTTRNPEYNIGDRVCLPDGRVFRYALAIDTVGARKGNVFHGSLAGNGIAETTLAAAQDVGDEYVTVATQTFAKDELRGGYITLCAGGVWYMQFRGIMGNTACSGTTVTIYLDAALHTAVTDATEVEVLPNPYRYISGEEFGSYPVAGVAIKRATVGQYFWIQTWGVCRPEAGAALPDEIGAFQLVWGHDGGAVRMHTTALACDIQQQHAGFILEATPPGTTGSPFIMLQISP